MVVGVAEYAFEGRLRHECLGSGFLVDVSGRRPSGFTLPSKVGPEQGAQLEQRLILFSTNF